MIATGWPEERPPLEPRVNGWFDEENATFLTPFVKPGSSVLEIGSWLGKSAIWFAEHVGTEGIVWTVDHFKGDPGIMRTRQANEIPTLWEQFVSNCWDYREIIRPLRGSSSEALPFLAGSGCAPSLIYVDGAHDYENAFRDVMLSCLLWPTTIVIGDDFNMADVRDAVSNVAFCLRRRVVPSSGGRCFELQPR